MKRAVTIVACWMIMIGFLLSACGKKVGKKLNSRITIWRNDKIPYGAYYAFQELPYLFPNAEIVVDKEAPDKNNFFQTKEKKLYHKLAFNKGKTAHVYLTPRLLPNSDEVQTILNYAKEGNQVFISSFLVSPELLDTFKLDINYQYAPENGGDSIGISIQNPENKTEEFYKYPGMYYDSYFSTVDSGFTTILGWNHLNKPNFVRIGYDNGGAIFLHLVPLAFSNFFLLHKENKRYYDDVFSNLPKGIELLVWNEYFRNHTNEEGNRITKAFSWLMKQPPLAWAVWLLLLLFLLIYLLDSKRKQKIIPVKKLLVNSSLDFVKTIGRVYYQRKDNKNLAAKMNAHFLDYVRSKYNLSTSRIDEEFEKRLAYKAGMELQLVHNIIYQAKYLTDQPTVTDWELMQFNQQLQNFYKYV